MDCLITLGFDETAIFKREPSGLQVLAAWPFAAIQQQKDSIEQTLQSLVTTGFKSLKQVVVVVDMVADVLHETPLPMRRHKPTASLRRSLALQLLERRQYQRVLVEPGWQKHKENRDRYFALEDSPELARWLDLLKDIFAAATATRGFHVIPFVLSAEKVLAHELSAYPLSIYCHIAADGVYRHTLFRDGKACFTRVPGHANQAVHQQAAQQLQATVTFLQQENLLSANDIPNIVIPPNVSTELVEALSGIGVVIREGDLPGVEITRSSDDPALAETTTQRAATGLTLYQSAGGHKALAMIDLYRLEIDRPASVLGRLVSTWQARFPVSSRLTRVLSTLCLIVVVAHCLNLVVLLYRQQNLEQQLNSGIASVRSSLQNYDRGWSELVPALAYRHWIREKPEELVRFLQRLGLQLGTESGVKLNQLQWCWAAAGFSCLDQTISGQPRLTLSMSGEVEAIETLQIRLVGEMAMPYLTRQADYERYRHWRQSLLAPVSMTLVDEEIAPHNPQHESVGVSVSVPKNARTFSIVLQHRPGALSQER